MREVSNGNVKRAGGEDITYANIQRLGGHQQQPKNSPKSISTSVRSVPHRSYPEGQPFYILTSQLLASGHKRQCILVCSVSDCFDRLEGSYTRANDKDVAKFNLCALGLCYSKKVFQWYRTSLEWVIWRWWILC